MFSALPIWTIPHTVNVKCVIKEISLIISMKYRNYISVTPKSHIVLILTGSLQDHQ